MEARRAKTACGLGSRQPNPRLAGEPHTHTPHRLLPCCYIFKTKKAAINANNRIGTVTNMPKAKPNHFLGKDQPEISTT